MSSYINILDRLFLAFLIIIILLSGYLLFQNRIRKQSSIVLAKQMQSQRIAEMRRVEKELQGLKNTLNNSKKELAYLNEKIPESAEIGEVLKDVGILMSIRKLPLTNIQPLASRSEGPYTRIPIRLIFQAPFIQVFQIVQDLESMKRAFIVDNLNLKRNGGDENCQVDLTVSIFKR
jgi:Tfp pilus assembly protein PilO